MLEILVINYKPIGKILLISVIFLTIHVVVLYDKIKRFLLDNWGEYRSHPLVIPFAGFIKPEEGKTALESSSSNFKKVIANMNDTHISYITVIIKFIQHYQGCIKWNTGTNKRNEEFHVQTV